MGSAARIFLPGLLFGAGLGISGMTNPAKVTGFLDLTGQWDPSLALVMAAAVGSFSLLSALLRRRQPACDAPAAERIDLRLLAGAALFGVGWGLGGICPGPALANLGGLRVEALLFVPAMALGMILSQRFLGADR